MYRFAHSRRTWNKKQSRDNKAMSLPPANAVRPMPDVVILGAGLIGLATALELSDRGAAVTVIDRVRSLTGASTAAAGMLAAEDPYNPPQLLHLSRLSAERYPAFLRRIEALSGIAVPFQTETTVQYLEDGSTLRLAERSIDPRQLAAALLAAVKATSIRLIENTHLLAIDREASGKKVHLTGVLPITAQAVLYAAGAWTSQVMNSVRADPVSIEPRKGQMLRVRLPFALNEVHRSEQVYIVPRTTGPQAGTALIGATIESAGFNTTVHDVALDALRALAAQLLPEFASKTDAPAVESWAGLRPVTPDMLPVLGACARAGEFIATGHYRNGILQAPATALVMADLIEGKPPMIDLSALSPLRFTPAVTTQS
jgi:glycine oxidase